MYAIREMHPDDRNAVAALWDRRVRWADRHGLGPLHPEPPAGAHVAAALPLVLTCDTTVAASATVLPADPAAGTAEAGEPVLDVTRLVTDPDLPMPEAGPLSWIVLAWIGDLAARNAYAWVRMRIAPPRLADHLRTNLAWELQHPTSVQHHGGDAHHVLRRRAQISDAIHALVRTPAATGRDTTPPVPLTAVDSATQPGSRALPPLLAPHPAGRAS
ncbi:hypothetical protein [Streptomyces anthocyanicus]|uniref:hypothetical protein n=1 Tax=Streptomyces anthocyanicus TaxID=68174 RepID=UPI0037FB9862